MATGRSSKAPKVSKKRGSKKSVSTARKTAKQSRPKKPAKTRQRVIVLDSKLCIKDIHQLKESLAAALESDEPVVIDGSAVESADTAALQLLTAFAIVAHGRPGTLTWKSASPALQELASMLDLHQHLAIDCEQFGGETDDLRPVS